MCGRRADDVWMTYVICHLKSPTKSHSRVIRTSSARRLHVIRTSSARHPPQDFNPEIFPVKEQRAALLKRMIFGFSADQKGLKLNQIPSVLR